MQTNLPTEEGFVPRPNYKRTKQRVGKIYKFTSDPVGRTVKILIGLIGDRSTTRDVVMRRNLSQQGASKLALYNQLMMFVPWFPAYYLSIRGLPLTPHVIYTRYYTMIWEDGEPKLSKEYYMHSKKLRPYVPGVDAAFIKGLVISEDHARKLGSVEQGILI